MKYYIGIDLGGTNIVAGVVNESYEILAKASVKTNLPRPEEEIAADMAKVSKEAAEQAGLTMADRNRTTNTTNGEWTNRICDKACF